MTMYLFVQLSDLGAAADLLVDDVQWCHLIVQNIGGHLGHVSLVQVPADPLHLLQQAGLYHHACSGRVTEGLTVTNEAAQAVHQLAITTPSMHLVFASALLPDVKGNSVGLLFSADQVHVVGNEELASTSHRGSP